MSAEPKLSANEKIALLAWEPYPEFVLPFRTIAANSGLEQKHVRRTVRSLARKGLAFLGTGFSEDDGLIAGRGYQLTVDGERALRVMLAERSK